MDTSSKEHINSLQDQRPPGSTMLLKEVEGHDLPLSTLHRAFGANRLHHAYLFQGPSGVGKRRSALAMARLLLCLNLQDQAGRREACGDCKSCRRINRFLHDEADAYHPDLHVISRQRDRLGKLAKEIKIAPIRELQSALSLGSFEGGRSIVIIEEVDRLGLSAANALLKTLEEPLPNVHFFLTTNSLNAVLPTIKSRAQSLRFAPLNSQILYRLLQRYDSQPVSQGEDQVYSPLSDSQRESLSQLSGGSLGRALSLWSYGGMDKVESLIQESDRNGGPQDILGALEFAKRFEKATETELALWVHLLRCWYRDALVISHGAQEASLFFPTYREYTAQRGHQLGAQRLMWRLQALDEAESHMLKRTGSNRKLIMETLCLYLAGFDALNQRPLQLS